MSRPVIQVRVSKEDKEMYQNKAWDKKMRLSEFMRDLWEAGWNLKYGHRSDPKAPR